MLCCADLEEPCWSPRFAGQARSNLVLIRHLDCTQGLLAVADHTSEEDKARSTKPVHELRCASASRPGPRSGAGDPVAAVNKLHRENSHGRRVPAATDISSRTLSCWVCVAR